jgi:lipoate-protein ligase A
MNWDLICDGGARGAWNMAVDEALLQSASATPVLRFYEWKPACLSLGRFQPWDQILASSELMQHELEQPTGDLDWVRRPTGGRAVWHQHEITYSAVLREDALPRESRSVVGAYRWLSDGFIEGLKTLGVNAELAPTQSKAEREDAQGRANCFDAATRCDFVVNGRKLIGAAQCRRNNAILQHGSLLLRADIEVWRAATGSAGALVSLEELGVKHARGEIQSAIVGGLARRHGIMFLARKLNANEHRLATGLHKHKYARDDWNIAGRAL